MASCNDPNCVVGPEGQALSIAANGGNAPAKFHTVDVELQPFGYKSKASIDGMPIKGMQRIEVTSNHDGETVVIIQMIASVRGAK